MLEENIPHRPSLNLDEAVQVWLMRGQGLYQSEIAHRLGTNQGRVNEVLKEKKHLGSKLRAVELKDKI